MSQPTHLDPGRAPNTCQYTTETPRGDYLVQIAWPLGWSENRVPPEDDPPASILYLVDGNAFFFTASDITRRLEFTHRARIIVVGIGYPLSKSIYTWRRGPDLTPPTPDGKYEYPLDRQGNPRTDLKFGEADQFLRFIEQDVILYVEGTVFQHVDLAKGRRTLFGHSYGGIFALNALYTSTALFDAYIAASPSIFWSDYALVKNQEADFLKRASAQPPVSRPPSVVVTWGTSARELVRQPGESEENFMNRKAIAESNELKPSVPALIGRLGESPGVGKIQSHELPGEDHGSAAVVGLQKGIMDVLVGIP